MGMGNVLGTQYLLPTKKQKQYTISVTVGVIVNFILNYILIKLFQSVGASIATVVSELVVVLIQYSYIRNEINLKTLVDLGWKYLISGIVMFVISLVFVLLSYYQGTFVVPCMTAILYISFASLLFFLEYWFIFKAYKLCKVVVLQPLE